MHTRTLHRAIRGKEHISLTDSDRSNRAGRGIWRTGMELKSANKTGGRTVFIEGNARTIVERGGGGERETGEESKQDRSSFVSMESELLTRINTKNHKKKSNTGLRAVTKTLARKNRRIKLVRNWGIKEENDSTYATEGARANFSGDTPPYLING